MKKALKIIASYFPFVVIWWFLLLAISAAYTEGWLNIFHDAYGMWMVILGCFLTVIVLTAPFWLRFLLKCEGFIVLWSYILIAALFFGGIFVSRLGAHKFDEFSVENWRRYPAQRIAMFDALTEDVDLTGFPQKEIRELFGEPDELYGDGHYLYQVWNGNAVYIEFEAGYVVDYYAVT